MGNYHSSFICHFLFLNKNMIGKQADKFNSAFIIFCVMSFVFIIQKRQSVH